VVEFVNWKVTGVGGIERPRLEMAAPTGLGQAIGERAGFALYRRQDLPAGFEGVGPAIVEEYGSTSVVEAGFRFQVDRLGNLVLHAT
jgi:N-methylhydantoinase A